MDNLPDVRRQPPDHLTAESRQKSVGVTDWNDYIDGALMLGDESMEEWLKFEGEPVEVLSEQ